MYQLFDGIIISILLSFYVRVIRRYTCISTISTQLDLHFELNMITFSAALAFCIKTITFLAAFEFKCGRKVFAFLKEFGSICLNEIEKHAFDLKKNTCFALKKIK